MSVIHLNYRFEIIKEHSGWFLNRNPRFILQGGTTMPQVAYGNLQKIKNGKRLYSITPRIPGGFVSATNLEKFAEVARKYKCSIKLTSGQRIMLIGLKKIDVSTAYEDLGLEPTVKSQ